MGALELKNIIQNYIDNADEGLLNVIKAAVEKYTENDIVGYAISGEPLTRKQYRIELSNAETEDCITQDKLEQESENW